MSRKIAIFCALVGVLALLAVPAYAEVQNIKISGDITAMGVYRNNYDLEDSRNWSEADSHTEITPGSAGWYIAEDADSLFMSVVRLRVDADLTDNVSAAVRVANVREWDLFTAGQDDEEIILDLAYVTLKEMLYSPLTVIIGRQELSYGNGLIVGNGSYQDINNTLTYNDLSPLHGRDAIRATLDYDPWTLDLVLVKLEENDDDALGAGTGGRQNDRDLYGANLGYRFDRYDAEMEAYLFVLSEEDWNTRIITRNSIGGIDSSRQYEENDVYTFGLRGSVVPTENLTLAAEVAGQFGEITDDEIVTLVDFCDGNTLTRDREAMAANVAAEYNFANVRFNPAMGVEYLYLSGEESGGDGSGDYEVWDTMLRGKRMGTIRDMLGAGSILATTNDAFDTSGWTNQHTVKVTGGLDLDELVDGLSLDLAFLHYWFDEEPLPEAEDGIGNELCLKVTYDYTEDVQFVLDNAVFMPGDYYDDDHINGDTGGTAARVSNDNAVSIVGSCKVTF